MSQRPTHAIALLLLATPLAAQAELTVTGSAVQAVLNDPSLDPLAEDDWFHAGRVELGIDLWHGLGLTAAYEGSRRQADLFGSWRTDLRLNAVLGGVRYRYEALSWLWPYLRVDLGAVHGSLEIDTGDADLTDAAWGFLGAAYLGLQIGLPKAWVRRWFNLEQDGLFDGMSAAIDLAVGYGFSSGLTFGQAQLSGPQLGHSLAELGPDFGTLDLAGLRSSIGLSLHF